MSHMVVVIEDDTLFARGVRRALEGAGYAVQVAEHAPQAIEYIDEFMPQVIVADMLLAGSTAVLLFHELQSHHDLASIPIIVVTSIAENIDLDVLKPYGVHRIIDKLTMRPEDIVTAVRSVAP